MFFQDPEADDELPEISRYREREAERGGVGGRVRGRGSGSGSPRADEPEMSKHHTLVA